MIVTLLLVIICIILLINTNTPEKLEILKEKYRIIREHFIKENMFHEIHKEMPITAFTQRGGSVGYNINKGTEIGVCLDGNINEIFHVLLHELAHCTVKEYSHSKNFWKNFEKIRDVAIELGIYTYISEAKDFCGKHVSDGKKI